MQAITVTALNKYVKAVLEKDTVLSDISIRGEISNFVNHYKTGHFYFTLKDTACSVKAVMFKSDAQRMAFKPENGLNVIAFCRVSLFERDGSFQIYVAEMLPDGAGAMQLAFEQLKERLATAGLFSTEHKKPIPKMPESIAVVTSNTGAAIQDIINVMARRYPVVKLIVVPVTVQGMAAAQGIADGIKKADMLNTDIIIVARGGGSMEDLWVFNDERIARAAFNAQTPLISAIGHEIDFTILDFVSDLRAPTPSAAAELATPDLYALFAKNTEIYTNIKRSMQNRLNICYNKVKAISQSHALIYTANAPVNARREFDSICDKITLSMHNKITAYRKSLSHNAALAQSLSPYTVLARGYAIVKKEGNAYNSVAALSKGDAICVEMKDGFLNCNITDVVEAVNAKL